MKPLIVTATGPSGSGKTVLSHLLRDQGFEPLVSTTTRLPRQNEQDGVDYHFVSRAQFDDLARHDGLIESVEYDGNCYGISTAEAERAFGQGKPAVLVAEPHGVAQIHQFCKQRGWDMVRVFVTNPQEVLIGRLLQRFHQDTAAIDTDQSIGKNELEKKIHVYANRIGKVTGFEQEQWVKPAMSGETYYDLIVDRFDSENRDQVLQKVLDVVQKTHGPVATRRAKHGP